MANKKVLGWILCSAATIMNGGCSDDNGGVRPVVPGDPAPIFQMYPSWAGGGVFYLKTWVQCHMVQDGLLSYLSMQV